jgi:GR25 family glycosyltransferase involved in LPS biosynthesis
MTTTRVKWALVIAALAVLVIAAVAAGVHHRRGRRGIARTVGNLSFDVYVINMKSNPERMRAFMKAYGRCDLAGDHSVIRHEGTVGKDQDLVQHVTTKALKEILAAERTGYRTKHYQLTRGGIGCYLSHVSLWKKILKSDKDYAVIFEDDCVPALNMKQLMRDSVPHDPGFDMCMLGYFCIECDGRPDMGRDTIGIYKFFGMHAYMISRRGIEKFLRDPRSSRIPKQIDHVVTDMVEEGTLRVVALESPIAWQNNADHASTIQMPLRAVPGVDPFE